MTEPGQHDRDVRGRCGLTRLRDVVGLHVDDAGAREPGAKAVQRCHERRRAHVRRTVVAHVGRGRQATDHGDRAHGVGIEREDRCPIDRLVLEEDDGPGGDGASQGPPLGIGHDVERRVVRDPGGVRAQLGGDDPSARTLHHRPPRLARRQLVAEMFGPLLAKRLFEVHPCVQRLATVTHAPDEVRDGDAAPIPHVPQHGGQQIGVLPAPLAVDRVVGAHHRGHSLVDDPLEVRQVDIVQGRLVHCDVHAEAGVLHGVGPACT